MYIVKEVEFEKGVISGHNDYTKTKTIKEFLEYVPYTPIIIKVKGYKFNRVYLTNGTKENGYGYAFVKM